MSDYARANTGGASHFGDKDALTTGDANKTIVGSQFDTEFNAIVTAVATKYDSSDLASQAQAEAETLNTVLITPLRLANWADANLGLVGDLQALSSDPAADRLVFFDDTDNTLKFLTASTGLAISGTNITSDDANIDHDALNNFVADEHIAHSGVTVTAGTGLTGGGTIDATITLNVIGGNGITANADDIALTDAAASTTNPVDISSGVVSLDVEALTTIEGSALAATDTFYVEDGGVSKGVEVQAMGLRAQLAQTTQTLAADDMNSIMEFTGTATLTLPLNSTTALPIGVPVILNMKHATQQLTVTADTSVTLVTVNHPAGGSAASDTVLAGGTALLYKTAADVWALSGDITD